MSDREREAFRAGAEAMREAALLEAKKVRDNLVYASLWPGASRCVVAIRALPLPEPPASASPWQPIETAPDGPLLLFSPTSAGNVRGGMVWVSGGFRFEGRAGGFRGDQGHEPPTHWTRIPEPPDA